MLSSNPPQNDDSLATDSKRGHDAMSFTAKQPAWLAGENSFGKALSLDDGMNYKPRRVGSDSNLEKLYDWATLEKRFIAIRARARADRAFFYRHGATKYNERNLVSGQHNTVLSDEGRAQAKNLQEKMPPQIDLIVCSELDRAIETMRLSIPAPARKNTPILLDARLNEVHLGALQGKSRTYLHQFAEGDLDWAPPSGESYRQAARRVLSIIVDLFDALATCGPPPRNAVTFCHAGVLRIISTLIDASDNSRDVFKTKLANTECLAVSAGQLRLPPFWDGGDQRGTKHDSL
jgi:glucosyl-3-phosphoglycerate phosphatase